MHSMRSIHPAVATTVLVLATSCGAATDEDPAESGQTAEPIIGGTPIPASGNVAPFSSVVGFWAIPSNPSTLGGAIKIGRQRFLTAGHALTSSSVGDTIALTNAVDLSGRASYTLQNVWVHASYLMSSQAGGLAPSLGYDVGVFDVNETDDSIPWFSDLRAEYIPLATKGSLVAYGCNVQAMGSNNVKRLGVLTSIASSGTTTYPDDWQIHYFIHNDGVVAGCPSDSGGGLFVRSASNAWQIGGLNARGPTPTMETRTGSVLSWIQSPGQNDFSDNSGGFFLNQLSGMCMAVSGASVASGADVRQYHHDGRAQAASSGYWTLVPSINGQPGIYKQIVNGRSGLCLGVDGASTADGANVSQYTCDNSFNQSWGFVRIGVSALYAVKNFKSGKCLGVAGSSTANDADIRQYNCASSSKSTQNWVFTK